MRRNPRLFRLAATVALTALLGNTMLPLAANAQPMPPPLPQPGQGRPDLNQGDPPARVGRIAGMTGDVSFHNEGDTTWNAASLNYPVSSGNAFWTEPTAQARLEISDSRIVMGGGTEFDVTTLDASGLQGVIPQGETYLHLRDLAPNEAWSIQTPRGLVRLSGQGRYDIAVGTTDQPTLVTVVDGTAQIDGPGVSLQVVGGQTATITGTDSFQGSVGPAVQDAFLTASLDAERPPPAAAVAVPAQVVEMAGGSDLMATGSWSDAPEYGQVWYPPVAAGWVPYREGHWAYVAPWGWTWIDNASWGFAPFHYGRWIEIRGRWAWTPGVVTVTARPVYAPALVTFIGIGAGVALGEAMTSGSIGWVPLGPREAYRPWYHASPNYVREVNVTHVTNINTTVRIDTYVNRGAATSVPVAAMMESRPVRAIARPVTAQEFAAARPIEGRQPIRPTAATAGVTQSVARRLDLAPAPTVHAAPGPAVRPVAAGFARPAFPSAGNRPVPAAADLGHKRPVTPGARPADVPALRPGRPGESVQPEARPGEAARPQVRPGESVQPEARPGEAARPQVRPGEPVRPEARPGEAARPEVRPGEPARSEARPEARPGEPARSEARPGTSARPEVRPGTSPRAEARPAAPVRPEARPEAPARPEVRQGEPARPEARPAAPARPEARPEAPARPEVRPVAPARPEARPAAPAHPEPQEHNKEPGQH
jgi:hypothetical protein